MNVLSILRDRFSQALRDLADDAAPLVEMVKPSQDPKFGDYQANCAMPLANRLKRPPREVAEEILARLNVDDLCQRPEIAGPGFINLRLRDDWLAEQLNQALSDDERLGMARVEQRRTFVIDYSAPNVAKPMHVGHIRSTVIGDSLYRVLSFLGHRVIGDNHIGDWGTQFGMILYGYKHFLDQDAYERNAVEELGRLYRLVNQLVTYQTDRNEKLPRLEADIEQRRAALAESESESADPAKDKKAAKARRRAEAQLKDQQKSLEDVQSSMSRVEQNPELAALAAQHADIAQAVLDETSKLHAGDEQNRRLWQEFLPPCHEEIDDTYRRLHVTFDHTLGESFYHNRLQSVVDDLRAKGIATESDGAVCVFIDGQPAPMIVQKQDGAFLYATTDLATIQYRVETFGPDAILYVVDFRQSLHFEQLFATARLRGCDDVELRHIRFGTVLGEDNRPYRTRSGDTIGLSGLLDEAISRALVIVSENDDAKSNGPELSQDDRRRIAEVVGIGGLKYADLVHNRESDYVFSYDKMLANKGNTATYMQYAYARVRSIFAKGKVDAAQFRHGTVKIQFDHPAERALGLEILRFAEAIDEVAATYEPHHLAAYLFSLANCYSTFFEQCPVLKAETPESRDNRFALCDLTARTIKLGLALLGIDVVEKM